MFSMTQYGTGNGFVSSGTEPHTVPGSGYARTVTGPDLCRLVADNLLKLIDADEKRTGVRLRHEDLAKKAGVGKGTIGRILRAEAGTGIDTLELVAGVFRWRAWQLLPGPIEADAPPEILTKGIRVELTELRAIRKMVEGFARDRGDQEPSSDGDRRPAHSQDRSRKRSPSKRS